MINFTADQLAIMRECRMLGWSFVMIAEFLKLQSPAAIQICCQESGWAVPLDQFDAERARCSESAANAAAASLTAKGHAVERIAEQLFRVDGQPARAARLLEMADAQE